MKRGLILTMLIMMAGFCNAEKRIRVSDGQRSVVFALNGTSAAESLYAMMPFDVKVDNYSNNEKIFTPPTTVSYGKDCIEGECPIGTIALFSPWGNVAMYYGAAPRWSGLYLLGTAVEGVENIRHLSGTIRVEQVEEATRVEAVDAARTGQTAYSLAGTPNPQKGIVVENRKKYFKK